MCKTIAGIQQVGVGTSDASAAWRWYGAHFGLDIPVFDDTNVASVMRDYTGGKIEKRRAILGLNLQGGAGIEVWQYLDNVSMKPDFEVKLGDLGIFIAKVKCKDVVRAHRWFLERGVNVLGAIRKDPLGNAFFFVKDPFGNLFQVVEWSSWFKSGNAITGGVVGCTIGVSNAEASKSFYGKVLGYDKVLFDKSGVFEDLEHLPGGTETVRRVVLSPERPQVGFFSQLLGDSTIELIEVESRSPQKIFHQRRWGDEGFIHLCFDVKNMSEMEQNCQEQGFPFQVDSRKEFAMGEASGHFSYVEDPDGTLIEFVQTYRIPIVKKWGWYLNLHKKETPRPLPKWMLQSLVLNKFFTQSEAPTLQK